MKKQIFAALAAGLIGFGAQAAPTLLDFTVSEGSVPGAAVNTVTADKLNGFYNEKLTISLGGPTGLSFVTTAYAGFTAMLKNEGTMPVFSQLGPQGAPVGFSAPGYAMYAIFTSAGTFSGGSFTGNSGTFMLYIDSNQDTTLALGATGADPVAVGNNSDDYMIASSSSLFAGAGLVGNPGAFDLFFKDFTLTTTDQLAGSAGNQSGATYFTAPVPFHMVTNVDGDFDNFVPAPGTIDVVGDVSAVFIKIPEPTSLALVGLALAGMGAVQRRKQVK